ncbi:MAG: hypothetical protein IJI07_11830 [Flexilinea sp.]|nr:hypothetical protein [Flexilinea sp.]
MDRITQAADDSYSWDCSIDRDYHRKTGREGLLGILFLCAIVFFLFLQVSHGTDLNEDLWIPLVVIGVILLISLPLLFLWNSAGDPHERYIMTEDYVRSGYGKSAVYSEFKKTKEVVITGKYIEMIGNYRNNRIYVPPEDMDFVREFILERLPEEVRIRRA